VNSERIGAIILAAGGSTRLGEPKQFLRHHDETLVRRAARAALEAGCSPVVIVAGLDHARVEEALVGLNVKIRQHEQWALGIGSSIRSGVEYALHLAPSLDALMLMVCDQPFVTAEILAALITARMHRPRSSAATYDGAVGVPALFDCTLFPMLRELPDKQGARNLLARLNHDISHVAFPSGGIDVDTPDEARKHLVNDTNRAARLSVGNPNNACVLHQVEPARANFRNGTINRPQ
jgi:molybdenum cofactor cytidylyltransferase